MTRYTTTDFGHGFLQVSYNDIPDDLKDIFTDMINRASGKRGEQHMKTLPDGTIAGAVWEEAYGDIRYWLWTAEYARWTKNCTTTKLFTQGYQKQALIFFGHVKVAERVKRKGVRV